MTESVAAERARLVAEIGRIRAVSHQRHATTILRLGVPWWERLDQVSHRYQELLPEVAVARCPHTGEPVRWPIDTYGLDGPFWDYLRPIRRVPAAQPRTWLAMAGALRLAEPVAHPPFAVSPGPDVPFVVPRILRAPGVRAVIAQVPVGAHTGWAISYFGPAPEGVPLVNLWGTNTYPVYRDGAWRGWAWDRPRVAQWDFALADWVRTGALLWIEPGDASATLREGVAGCPYLDLPGTRRITVIANGAVQRLAAFAGHGAG
jgi:hypothetical protein